MTAAPEIEEIYLAKEPGYFNAAREDLLALVAGRELAVLEIGAGTGETLAAAKARGIAKSTLAIELVAPARPADGVDRFIVGSIESIDLAPLHETLDLILIGDVLEHLVDPWKTVERLLPTLKAGGRVVCSLPNSRNFRLLRRLVIDGDFSYEPAGLMDIGHLRFFCRKNALELFERAGFRIVRVAENMGGYGRVLRFVDRLTFGRLHEFFVFQYRIVAERP